MAIGRLGWQSAARAVGCVAIIALAVVGCTTVIDGAPNADTAIAPAYRASVSASVSASVATSSVRESQRQQSLTTKAVVRVCESFVISSKEAVDRVNDFVAAYNNNGNTSSAEGPAVDALNHSADTVEGDANGPRSQELREALKRHSNWPTYPQLYVKGELVGGCDIALEMYRNGELRQLLETAGAVTAGAT